MAELREVDGFLFSTEEEYQNALKEQKAVAYLKKQMSGKDGKSILKVYNQLLEQKIFKTEVGYAFLHDINLALHRQSKIAESVIKPIPVERAVIKETMTISNAEAPEEKPPKVIVKTIQANSSKQVKALRIVIIVLIVVIIGMFGITLTSQTPTIIDYETKLQDKYAAWEQQLTQREAQIKAKELELNID